MDLRVHCGQTIARPGSKGLVSLLGGVTENTVRAALTAKGRELSLSPSYVSPAEAALLGLLSPHERYRAPAVDEFDCCVECNRSSGGYVPFPCKPRLDVEAALKRMSGA